MAHSNLSRHERPWQRLAASLLLAPSLATAGLDRERSCDGPMIADGKCKGGDVIFVHSFDIARYCDMDKRVVPLADKGQAAAVCYFVGYERKTRADYF